jgi:hypothetical protein
MSVNMKNIMTMISNSNTDAVIDALDKFCEMIKELDNIDAIIAKKDAFKTTFKIADVKSGKTTKTKGLKADGSEKKKRAPSMFNLYVKWIMPILKETGAEDGHEVKSNELMSMAADKWKNNSDPFGVFVKEHTKTFKKHFASLEATEIFQKMRTCFEEGGDINAAIAEGSSVETDDVSTEIDEHVEVVKEVVKEVPKKTASKATAGAGRGGGKVKGGRGGAKLGNSKAAPVPAPVLPEPVPASDSDSDSDSDE